MEEVHLLLISKRPEDEELVRRLAERLGWEFNPVPNRAVLQNLLIKHPKSILIWSVDDLPEDPAQASFVIETMRTACEKLISARRVFALATEPVSRNRLLFEKPPIFQHQLFRREIEVCLEPYAALLQLAQENAPARIAERIITNSVVDEFFLTESQQRSALVDQISAKCEERGLGSRLSGRFGISADELLMNSVFNAPHNDKGFPTRRTWPRNKAFKLPEGEKIDCRLYSNDHLIAISVVDFFGSMSINVFNAVVAKDFHKKKYKVNETQQGAGLGLHGIIENGFSIIFSVEAKVRSEIVVLMPKVTSQKVFRASFQFCSFFGDPYLPEWARPKNASHLKTLWL